MDDPNSFTDFQHSSTQDYELFPDADFADSMLCQRTAEIQRQISHVDHTMKTPWLSSSMPLSTPGVHLTQTASPYSMEASAFPMGSDISSPFGGAYSSSGAESPQSNNWRNMGCYMSPPSSCADTMLPLDHWGSCSPGPSGNVESSIAPSQIVQNYPVPIPIAAELELEAELDPELDPRLDTEPLPVNEPTPVHSHNMHQHSQLDPTNETLSYLGAGQAPDQDSFTLPSPPRVPANNNTGQKTTMCHNHGSKKSSRRKETLTSNSVRVCRTSSKSKTKKGTRPRRTFVCTFSRYGCTSSFTSKNEWKRHVTSQHVQLGFYRCDVGQCNVNNPSKGRPMSCTNDFNRKDLFTQHQRRMHAPWAKSKQATEEEKQQFDATLEAVRTRCWHEQRRPPSRSACGFCGEEFAGFQSWNQRMEHVGRHYEKGDVALDSEKEDIALRDWAIQEGILSWGGGRWKLASHR
ncbi:putative C2H2 finger domain protein [Aspergillus flavus]|uniref:C2H2 finger domain protein n=4 Tax=Aspergillus subgen. Circumdati TaxID=2720871 RepID=B8N605_ASPFN|nr:uncharacterized protein G4B84_006165 [Aspergillus flavus NRRL3357]OOO11090.1 hypothetical protein OAory_01075600 [Aspergillus oryzae]QMW42837.1 hypothetical protein G4B11_006207 [Aspergillus flavus]GMG43465.1 unnamed protein product [Aspergillus oryzae var. brunneus]KAF7625165.1 hypothetical protein AFLA_002039 [Aspergillus flavus NRRL3357]QMW30784.1 hypothetical protein G4B84_006165 [Aspergillus flavus NRRL3357]